MSLNQIFIDVREPNEFQKGHVRGAINIPPSELISGTNQLNNIPKNTELIVYCKSGSRSNASIQILKQLGYTNLVNGINKDQVEAKYKINT